MSILELDRLALLSALAVQRSQPRADATINELPLNQPLPTDTVPFFRATGSGGRQTYQTFVGNLGAGGATALEWFNVKAFGAYGDNVHDDTAAINACIAAACASGQGACVVFPAGIYLISNTLTISNLNQMLFLGSGQATVIQSSVDKDIFYVPSTAPSGTGLEFSLMQIVGPSKITAVTGAAINIGDDSLGGSLGATDCEFNHISTSGVGWGLKYKGGGGRNFSSGCKWVGTYVGAYEYGHGLKHHGDTINGGTYGLVTDAGADPRIVEMPIFGCLSILTMNTTGVFKGGTVYGWDVETNFGPPPSTSGTYASGAFTLTGTPTTGNSHVLTIAGYAVSCPEATGNTLTQQAAADAVVVNAYFNNPLNFPNNHNGDFQLVTALGSASSIIITATQYGYGGDKITIVGTSSATVTVAPGTKTALTGGADNGIWPGGTALNTFDTQPGSIGYQFYTVYGFYPGCGAAGFYGDHAQLNLDVPWMKDGVVLGAAGKNGPSFVQISGGNLGSSVKGPTQITPYVLDIQQANNVRINGPVLSQGAAVTGASIHIGTSTYVVGAVILSNFRCIVNNGNFGVLADDTSAEVQMQGVRFDLNSGSFAAGGAIQVTGASPAPFGTTGNWQVRDCPGFTPYGYIAPVGGIVASPYTFTNTYGMPVVVSITAGAGGTISNIALGVGGADTTTNLTSGAFLVQPGGQVKVTWVTTAPVLVVFGN